MRKNLSIYFIGSIIVIFAVIFFQQKTNVFSSDSKDSQATASPEFDSSSGRADAKDEHWASSKASNSEFADFSNLAPNQLRVKLRDASEKELLYVYNHIIPGLDDRQLANSLMIDIVNRLAEVSPESAITVVKNIGSGKFRQTAITHLLSKLPKSDMIRVANSNELIEFPEDERPVRGTISNRLANFSKDELIACIPAANDWFKSALLSSYGTKLASETRSFTDLDLSQFDSLSKEVIVSSWATHASLNDPEELATNQQLADSPYYEKVLPVIASHYAQKKPVAAAEWASKNFNHGDASRTAFHIVMYRWLGEDSTSAANWVVQSNLDNAQRDAAASQIYRYLTEKGDVAAANEWLESIHDEKIRNSIQSRMKQAE